MQVVVPLPFLKPVERLGRIYFNSISMLSLWSTERLIIFKITGISEIELHPSTSFVGFYIFRIGIIFVSVKWLGIIFDFQIVFISVMIFSLTSSFRFLRSSCVILSKPGVVLVFFLLRMLSQIYFVIISVLLFFTNAIFSICLYESVLQAFIKKLWARLWLFIIYPISLLFWIFLIFADAFFS